MRTHSLFILFLIFTFISQSSAWEYCGDWRIERGNRPFQWCYDFADSEMSADKVSAKISPPPDQPEIMANLGDTVTIQYWYNYGQGRMNVSFYKEMGEDFDPQDMVNGHQTDGAWCIPFVEEENDVIRGNPDALPSGNGHGHIIQFKFIITERMCGNNNGQLAGAKRWMRIGAYDIVDMQYYLINATGQASDVKLSEHGSQRVSDNLKVSASGNQLHIHTKLEGKITIVIRDLKGRSLYKTRALENKITLPSRLSSGSYIIEATNGINFQKGKLIYR